MGCFPWWDHHSAVLHTQYIMEKGNKVPRIKRSSSAESSPGSVSGASCSNGAVICARGNDLCHSASNRDLTPPLTHTLFIAVALVIPLYGSRVCLCVQRGRPAGRETKCWYFTACCLLKFLQTRGAEVNTYASVALFSHGTTKYIQLIYSDAFFFNTTWRVLSVFTGKSGADMCNLSAPWFFLHSSPFLFKDTIFYGV